MSGYSHRLVGARRIGIKKAYFQATTRNFKFFVSSCGPYGQNMTRINFVIVSYHQTTEQVLSSDSIGFHFMTYLLADDPIYCCRS